MAETVTGYDAIAEQYDRIIDGDLWMRHVLWRHYERLFHKGDRVCDVGCGTGLDSLHLASLGMRLTSIDPSRGMISQLIGKAANQGITADAHVAFAEQIGEWPAETFDGIISSFASLNTVTDLREFALQSSGVLKPGGRLVAHMLAPPCIWDWLKPALKGRLGEASRFHKCRETEIVVCSQPLRHLRLRARETYSRFFSSYFRLRACYSLGFLWHNRRPPGLLGEMGSRLEPVLGAFPPFLNWGRFFVIDMEKK